MSWNYRILKHTKASSGSLKKFHPEDYVWYAIHSVYYDKNGKPDGYSSTTTELTGESKEDLRKDMEKIQRAFEMPVLLVDGFPMEEKHAPSKSNRRSNLKRNKRS